MTACTILHLPFQLQQRLFYLHFKNGVTATTKARTANMEFKYTQELLFFLACFRVVSKFLVPPLLFFLKDIILFSPYTLTSFFFLWRGWNWPSQPSEFSILSKFSIFQMSRCAEKYENGHKSWPPSAAATALLH